MAAAATRIIIVPVSDKPDITCWAGVTTIAPASVKITYYRTQTPEATVYGPSRLPNGKLEPGSRQYGLIHYEHTTRPEWLTELVAANRPRHFTAWSE